MSEVIARKIIDENGDEIIELDLNKPWPSAGDTNQRKKIKNEKEFITILQ